MRDGGPPSDEGDLRPPGQPDPDGGAAADPVVSPDSPDFVASESLARRLSRAELDHTLHDLFGDDRGAASTTLPEDLFSPYDNDYTGQLASGAFIDSLFRLAEDVSAHVVARPELRARLVSCSTQDRTCFLEVAARLSVSALRRPVQEEEWQAYGALFDAAQAREGSSQERFDAALSLLVQAFVMDPEFLYRIEVGESAGANGVYRLSDYEIAARMSFLLWGTTPDEELLSDAQAGRLSEAEDRLPIARRMLSDPRARRQVRRFHAMWLGYRVVPHGPELASAFQRETEALIDRVVFDEARAHSQLFTFEETFIDPFLADHYGLPAPDGEAWVRYGDSGRAGIMSHGSFLSAFGKFSDTSPTQRGILVRKRLLCQEVPPPPPDVMADQPPGDADSRCKWDRYEAHRESSACTGCHAQLDPIGFGLENYDLGGRYREHDDGLPECAIDGAGQLPPYGAFSGPAELADLLVTSGELERCLVQQYLSFSVGRPLLPDESPEVERLRTNMLAGEGRLFDLIEAHIASDAFALRKEPSP